MVRQIFQLQDVNANSLRSRAKQHHMQQHLTMYNPQVMLISETKLKQEDQRTFNNYNMSRNERNTDGGGGTAVLIRENLSFEILQKPNNCDIECTITKIKLNESKKMVCIAAYLPKQTLSYEHIEQLMQRFGPHNIILGADLNAKHTSWNNRRNNPNGVVLRRWADDNMGRFQVLFPNEPTFLRVGREPAILDGFSVSTNLLGNNQNTVNTLDFMSDHRAIELELIFNDEIQTIEHGIGRNAIGIISTYKLSANYVIRPFPIIET